MEESAEGRTVFEKKKSRGVTQTEVQANIESPATQGVSTRESPTSLPAFTRNILTTAFQETSTSVTLHAAVQSSMPSTTAKKYVSVSTPSTPSSEQSRMTTAEQSSMPSTTAMKDVSTRSTPRSVQPRMTTAVQSSTPSTTAIKDVTTRSTPGSVQPSMKTISETTMAVQQASSIIPAVNRKDGNQASANCAANMSRDGLSEVLAHLKHISQQLERHVINVNLKLSDIQQRMTDVEKCLQEQSSQSQMTPAAEFAQPIQGAEQLNAEHRDMLHRSPLVSSDEQWLELETPLQDNGKDGLFLISRLRNSGAGCQLFDAFYGCLLYADDICH